MSSYISVSLCLCVLSLMRPSGIARLHAHPPQQPANMLSPFRTTRFNFFLSPWDIFGPILNQNRKDHIGGV